MILVCPSCQEELANVDAISAFNASVSCGKCGNTFGQRFAPSAPAVTEVVRPLPRVQAQDGLFFVDGMPSTRAEFDAAIARLG